MTRLDENAVLLNVTIPVQPISYDEAHELMLHMKGTLNNNFLQVLERTSPTKLDQDMKNQEKIGKRTITHKDQSHRLNE